MPPSNRKSTFAHRLVQDRGLKSSDFEAYVLRRTLHFPLRWIYPLLEHSLTDYLEPDIQCVRTVGTLRSSRQLDIELSEFSYHPRNVGLARRLLRQRLSTHRLYRLLRQLPRENTA